MPTLTPDPTGTGTSSFRDSFVASLFDGTKTYVLLLTDSSGSLTDPFGTAPGSVTIGTSSSSPSGQHAPGRPLIPGRADPHALPGRHKPG